jgi:hypothetical protein
MVRATEPGTAFIPWVGTHLAEILYVKVTVRVHEYPDGTLAVFHAPRCLARDQADGRLIETGRAHLARNGPTHGSNVPPIVDPRATVRDTISARG